MSCFGRGEAERAELREMLELSNSQREEARCAAEAAARRGDELARTLAAKQAEAATLAAQLREAGVREARQQACNEALTAQVAGLQAALERAAAARDEAQQRVAELSAERKSAATEVKRLTKDREYLKLRVDRMSKALSMLESVLDDTLRENQASSGGAGAAAEAAAVLRHSREAISELWSGAARAHSGGGAAAAQ